MSELLIYCPSNQCPALSNRCVCTQFNGLWNDTIGFEFGTLLAAKYFCFTVKNVEKELLLSICMCNRNIDCTVA